ncbi:MAG: hypothetical protein ACTHMW_03090, partial [Actinomycetes bacterium]
NKKVWPMLLVNPSAGALTPVQGAYLGQIAPTVKDVTVIGGSAAVPDTAVTLVNAGLGRTGA